MADGVAIEQRPGYGFCLVAMQDFLPGQVVVQEEPLLKAKNDELSYLRSFCKAPVHVRDTVLSLFCPPLEDRGAHMIQPILKIARKAAKRQWAKGFSVRELQNALVIHALNAFSFQNSSTALFEIGSKLTHSCDANTAYSSSRVRGCGCHIAIKSIEKGELITAEYVDAAQPTDMRREKLRSTKLFDCECDRCLQPDLTRAVPCPSCHPRQGSRGGMYLPVSVAWPTQGLSVHYAIPGASGSDWVCESCKGTFGAADVFPVDERGIDGTRRERMHEEWVLKIESELETGMVNGVVMRTHDVVFEDLMLTCQVFGCRHWASVKMMAFWCEVCLGHADGRYGAAPCNAEVCAKMRLDHDPNLAAAELQRNSQIIWAYCCSTLLIPVHFQSWLFLSSAGFLDTRDDKRTNESLRARALLYKAYASVRGGESPGTQHEGGVLKMEGNAAFKTTRFGEAILFYRGAHLIKPDDHTISSNLSAAFHGLQRYTEAAAAARHCVRLAPAWPKGHYRLAAALHASGKCKEAHEHIVRAAHLLPGDQQIISLKARIHQDAEDSAIRVDSSELTAVV